MVERKIKAGISAAGASTRGAAAWDHDVAKCRRQPPAMCSPPGPTVFDRRRGRQQDNSLLVCRVAVEEDNGEWRPIMRAVQT